MKILHISTYQKGGAAIAAYRLHQSLVANGYDSKFLFLECKESGSVFKFNKGNYIGNFILKVLKKLEIPLSIDEFRTQRYKDQFELFSFASSPFIKLHEHPLVRDADIINLHWVSNFVDYNTFFSNVNKPIFWTLHDMLPFHGGFHYKEDEIRNTTTLGELDRKQYAIKQKALSQRDPGSMIIVAPSKWLYDLSLASEILGKFAHKNIPYGIDQDIFRFRDKKTSKEKLGLTENKLTVLFVAEKLDNHRKGFDMIIELIKDKAISSTCTFIAVGKVKKADRIPEIKYCGTIKDEMEMSVIYNAADIFIIPSREDNLPNTMIESLCCGTPVVGFSVGGLKESITNYENGMLADHISVSELKDALLACVNAYDQFNGPQISVTAHLKYARELQLEKYLNIYNNCLEVREDRLKKSQ